MKTRRPSKKNSKKENKKHPYKSRLYDLCKCGNKKRKEAKQCRECFTSNKHKFQVSRMK